MNTKRETDFQERKRSPQVRAVTAIFIILFAVMCFLLARSMARHNFSGGGRDNIQSQHH
jgi:hypothetical protein